MRACGYCETTRHDSALAAIATGEESWLADKEITNDTVHWPSYVVSKAYFLVLLYSGAVGN